MAKLPQAVNVVGGVSPQQMPGVQAPADAFGADMGKAISQLGSFIEDEAQKQQRLDNQAEAQELSNELNTRLRNLELGDGDQEPGYKNRLGRDAMDQRQTYEEQAEKIRKELVGRATNPIVRQNFSGVAANRTGQFLTSVGGHFNAQRKAYRKTALDNTTNVATDDAVNATDDATRLARANDAYTATFNYHSDDLGRPDAIAKTFAEEARSKVHQAVILGLVNNQPTAARKYYEANKSQVDPGDRPALEKMLRGGYVDEQSATQAATIDAKPKLTYAQKLAEARKIEDIDVRDATVKRLETRRLQAERQLQLDNRARLQDTLEKIEKGDYRKTSDIPIELRVSLMENRQFSQIEAALKGKADRDDIYAERTDPEALAEIVDTTADPAAFRNLDLNKYKTKLDRTDWFQYKVKQDQAKAKYRGERLKGPKFDLGDEALREVISRVFGMTPAKGRKGDFGKAAAVVDAELRRYIQQQFDAEKPVNEAELKRIAIRGLMKIKYTDNYLIQRRDYTDFRAQAEEGREFGLVNIDSEQTIERVAAGLGVTPADARKLINKLIVDKDATEETVTFDKLDRLLQEYRAFQAQRARSTSR